MPMDPLRALAPRFGKSIQPALNPSIICMRGVGFFMPWARKSDSHRSRGTASARIPLRIRGRLLVSDSGTLIGACEAGAGIAQILELGCKHLLDDGRLVELFPEWSDERFPLYAIYPSRLHRAAKVRVFVEFCMEVLAGTFDEE